MPTLRFALLFLLTSTFIFSCSKEESKEVSSPSGASGTLMGAYKFVSEEAQTLSTVQTTMGGDAIKTVTFSHYITKDNTGIMQFDGKNLTYTNLSYSVDTTALSYTYINNVLQDSLEFPFQVSLPPLNTTAPYKMVGTDSIYISSGSWGLSGAAPGAPTNNTVPTGYKLRFDGNKLYMDLRLTYSQTATDQGVPYTLVNQVKGTVTLEKQ
ncbi:MAG: hypothetical protein ACXVBI_07760 [Flavisolibacter sp.]